MEAKLEYIKTVKNLCLQFDEGSLANYVEDLTEQERQCLDMLLRELEGFMRLYRKNLKFSIDQHHRELSEKYHTKFYISLVMKSRCLK